jgi:hypothetical protein
LPRIGKYLNTNLSGMDEEEEEEEKDKRRC